MHAPFANPRAKSCWLSCAFQVLWHSRAWHTCFEAALEAGALETSEWDTPGAPKIEALVDTWREYRQTLASHAPPPPLKKARTGGRHGTGLRPGGQRLAGAARRGLRARGRPTRLWGYERRALGRAAGPRPPERPVASALPLRFVPHPARALGRRHRHGEGPGIIGARPGDAARGRARDAAARRAGAAAARPVHGRRHGDTAAGREGRGVHHRPRPRLAADARRGADRQALARAFTPQPDAPIALYALVCYCHRLQHYVAYVKRQTSDAFLFFNDLPHLAAARGRAAGPRANTPMPAADGPPEMRAAVTWDEAVRTCGRRTSSRDWCSMRTPPPLRRAGAGRDRRAQVRT